MAITNAIEEIEVLRGEIQKLMSGKLITQEEYKAILARVMILSQEAEIQLLMVPRMEAEELAKLETAASS